MRSFAHQPNYPTFHRLPFSIFAWFFYSPFSACGNRRRALSPAHNFYSSSKLITSMYRHRHRHIHRQLPTTVRSPFRSPSHSAARHNGFILLCSIYLSEVVHSTCVCAAIVTELTSFAELTCSGSQMHYIPQQNVRIYL